MSAQAGMLGYVVPTSRYSCASRDLAFSRTKKSSPDNHMHIQSKAFEQRSVGRIRHGACTANYTACDNALKLVSSYPEESQTDIAVVDHQYHHNNKSETVYCGCGSLVDTVTPALAGKDVCATAFAVLARGDRALEARVCGEDCGGEEEECGEWQVGQVWKVWQREEPQVTDFTAQLRFC